MQVTRVISNFKLGIWAQKTMAERRTVHFFMSGKEWEARKYGNTISLAELNKNFNPINVIHMDIMTSKERQNGTV